MTAADLGALIRKNRVSTACGLAAVALAAAIYFRMDAIPEVNQELDEKSALARRYALNINNAAHLKEHMEALTTANKAIDSRLIRATDIGINQQYFYKLEAESGVKLLELRQGGRGTPKGGFAPIPFTVSLQGDFTQVMTFLRALEDRSHYCRVMSASCSGVRTSGNVTLSLNLELLGRP